MGPATTGPPPRAHATTASAAVVVALITLVLLARPAGVRPSLCYLRPGGQTSGRPLTRFGLGGCLAAASKESRGWADSPALQCHTTISWRSAGGTDRIRGSGRAACRLGRGHRLRPSGRRHQRHHGGLPAASGPDQVRAGPPRGGRRVHGHRPRQGHRADRRLPGHVGSGRHPPAERALRRQARSHAGAGHHRHAGNLGAGHRLPAGSEPRPALRGRRGLRPDDLQPGAAARPGGHRGAHRLRPARGGPPDRAERHPGGPGRRESLGGSRPGPSAGHVADPAGRPRAAPRGGPAAAGRRAERRGEGRDPGRRGRPARPGAAARGGGDAGRADHQDAVRQGRRAGRLARTPPAGSACSAPHRPRS